MHCMIAAVGTHGDVLPLITICRDLRARGHKVTFIAPAVYANTVQGDDVVFVPLSTKHDYDRSISDMYLLNTRYRLLFILRHALGWNKAIYATGRSIATRDLLLVAPDRGFLWADYYINFHLKIPVIRLVFDPPPLKNVTGEIVELPRSRVQSVLLQRLEVKWRRYMQEFGLKVGQGGMSRLRRSGSRDIPRIYLYPSWLTNLQGTRQNHHCGFIPPSNFHEECSDLPFDNYYERRLIVFLAGTLGVPRSWSDRFFSISAEICRRLNCQGLLLGGDEPRIAPGCHKFVAWRSFFPLHRILPHASTIVHHGGIGTIATALDNAVPQLIVPRFAWQPSTTEWFRRLGICAVLDEKAYTLNQGTQEIRRVLDDDSYRKRAIDLAGQCNPDDARISVCKSLEDFNYFFRDRPNHAKGPSAPRG
jgi:rhamnosyltransferase subunit B